MTNRLDEVQLYLTVFHCLRQRSEHPPPPPPCIFIKERFSSCIIMGYDVDSISISESDLHLLSGVFYLSSGSFTV